MKEGEKEKKSNKYIHSIRVGQYNFLSSIQHKIQNK